MPPRPGDKAGFDLIVNCTTVGLAAANRPPVDPPDHPDAASDPGPLPIDPASLSAEKIVVDLVYGSHPTPLATIARERGARVVDGLEVLVRQGAASLRIWTGLEPPLETMRRAARAATAADQDAPST
ncbi:MAG: hypothetical protein GEU88_15005 [Solirubrobacterales bacterium]|nr:hypothetical protein [Solirubrobacterales bacterium]